MNDMIKPNEKQKKSKFYIYGLYRNGIIFYIGMTDNTGGRLRDHRTTYGKDITLEIIDENFGTRFSSFALEEYWIVEYKKNGAILENKTGGVVFTGGKCLCCQRLLAQTIGKKEKLFCDSTCRSNYWQKSKRLEAAGKSPEEIVKAIKRIAINNKPENKKRIEAERKTTQDLGKKTIGQQPIIESEAIPPIPVKQIGEDSFDFAARKNEWKIKYGNGKIV